MIELQDAGGFVIIYYNGKDIGHIKYAHGWHGEIGVLKKHEIYSAMMNLAPAYRNRGIGTEAYKIFMGMMRKNGVRTIFAVPENVDSEIFMERLGFHKTMRPLSYESFFEVYELTI